MFAYKAILLAVFAVVICLRLNVFADKESRMLLAGQDITQQRLDVMQAAIQVLQSKLTAQEQKNAQQEALIQKLLNGTNANPVLSKITCSDNCCPDGYTKHHDACYRIFVELMSWPEAVTMCGINGAHLVRIETKSEFDFLSSWAISNQVSAKITTNELWIAGMEIGVEGEWMWPETMDRITYLPWGPGENPDDSRYNCVCMSHSYHYGYADIECERKINFICEINLHGTN